MTTLLGGCAKCGDEITGEKSSLDGNLVYNFFLENGLTTMFEPDEYQNNHTKLPFICNEHHEYGIQHRNYATLKSSSHCCNIGGLNSIKQSKKIEESFVLKQLENRDMIPDSDFEYMNRETEFSYRCRYHPDEVQYTNYAIMKNTKTSCKFCRNENSISSLNKRLRSSLNAWRKESELLCEYKCVLSGSKTYDIHHLYSYNSIILDSLKELGVENKLDYNSFEIEYIKKLVIEKHKKYIGVCLDPNIHTLFHQIYGKKNNTEEQFNEFSKRYKKGEFKDILS